MKKSVFGFMFVFAVLLSCRGDEDSLQKVDQIFNLYMNDIFGKDVLHPNKIGAYATISFNDVLGDTDFENVNYSRKMTADSVNYLEYIAGAKRVLLNDSDPENKIYYSKIAVSLTKKLTDSTFSAPDIDTLEIRYRFNPSVFEISKVFYNNSEVTVIKESNMQNVVRIIK